MNNKEILDNLIIGRVEPHIYAFTTETIPNYLKVGDTYRPVTERINEWKLKFPNLKKSDNWEWSAKVGEDENASYFRDFAVHKFLEIDKHKTRLTKDSINNNIYYSNEFFKDAEIKDVDEAIKDIQDSFEENDFKYDFYKYSGDTKLRQEEHYKRKDENWKLRNNQHEVVNKFVKAVNNGRTNLLMYAVMRFGKSFTSLMCAKSKTKICPNGSRLIVVVSGKADVKDEWKQNVEIPKNFENFVFLDAENLKNDKSIIKKELKKDNSVVCFLTLQDLQGNDIKEKHKELFKLSNYIDLLIIDETHFGARADKYGLVLFDGREKDIKQKYDKDISKKEDDIDYVDSDTANNIVKSLNAKIRLHLSGTPYRILMGSEFAEEDIIAFCQFNDILNEKDKWNKENINKSETNDAKQISSLKEINEWDNPYYGFPQMVRFACNLNKSSRERLAELSNKGVKFQLSELFKPQSIKKDDKDNKHKLFIFEKEISEMLLAIDGSKKDNELFSFLNYDKIKNGNMCRHMVIVLPYCASCDAMEELINKMSKKKMFKNLNKYEIINISGVDIKREYNKISSIKNKIRSCESENKKTITLTVNRMLTGVTVKEWDTMIYLKDTSSPQEYDQAIFRLQNQYVKDFKDNNGKLIKIDMKPQTLLVDYFPSRMFRMQENKSFIYNVNIDENGNDKIYDRLEEDLKISPIILFDENGIKEVTANDIMDKVSEYSKNRGVSDEVQEIPIDLNLIKDNLIYNAIQKENEIGSKEGLSFDAHNGEESDEDGRIVEPDNTEDNNNISNNNTNENVNKDEKEIIRKKFKTLYSRMLFYSYLCRDELKSLNDIILSLKLNADNKRIFRNLGLDKNVLAKICLIMDKFALRKLDYKIQNLNKLSREQKVGLDSAYVALKKFGRLGSSEIVTPPEIADYMVSLIKPKEYKRIVEDDEKILDIASKTGEFAISLVKKLNDIGISNATYRDVICSIPTSKIAYEFTRKIYELLGLEVNCIAEKFTSYDLLNVKCKDENGNDTKEIDYKTIKMLLSQSADFSSIEMDDLVSEEENKVKYGMVIGNPPYQRADGGAQASAEPIYQEFVRVGKNMTNQYVTMIMPSRWYAGGKGLDDFREEMLNDIHIVMMDDYLHPEEVFPNTNNRGGLCDFLWDNKMNNNNEIDIITHNGNSETEKTRMRLKNKKFDIFIRNPFALSILNKVIKDNNEDVLENHVSSRKPFGVESNIIKSKHWMAKDDNKKNTYQCLGKGETIGYVKLDKFNDNKLINIYKVFTPRANNIGTELGDDNFNTIIGHPGMICTEAYLVLGVGLKLNLTSAKNLSIYMTTKFARFMHSIAKASHDASKKTYCFIPTQDFTNKSDINWSKSIENIDKQLYKKYKLTKEEIAFIEKNIKPMK